MSGATPPAQPPPGPEHDPDPDPDPDEPVRPLPLPRPPRPVPLWRWRRNPLRRRTDRLLGWIGLSLLLLVPVLGLAATFAVGDAAHRHYRATAEHQARARSLLAAVLVHDAPNHPEPGSDEARKARYPVTVRFTAPDGRDRTAKADVLPGLTAGSTVTVWTDRHGALTEPPLTTEQIRSRTMGWALLAFMAVALAGFAVHGAAALILHRRNLAAWDGDWARTAPRWTTSP